MHIPAGLIALLPLFPIGDTRDRSMPHVRRDYIAVALAALFLGVGAKVLRRQPGIPSGWHRPLGWIPSFAFAAGIVSLWLALGHARGLSRERRQRIAISMMCGALVYEFGQQWSRRRTFDWWDVLALVAGAGIALSLERYPGTGARLRPTRP